MHTYTSDSNSVITINYFIFDNVYSTVYNSNVKLVT